MAFYESIINTLQSKLSELDIEMRSFDDYKVELHTPLNPEEGPDERPVHIAVDIYLHALNPRTNKESVSVCWYAIEIYANKDCNEFAPILNAHEGNIENYSEDDYGDILEAVLLKLLYKPRFINLINEMSWELIEKLKVEIAKL